MEVGQGGRRAGGVFGLAALAAHFVEVEHVEEVHRAEDEQDDAELRAHELEGLLRGGGLGAVAQRQDDEAHVDEVETDHEEVVDGVGHGLVAAKGLHEEDAAVAMERARDPNGQGDADDEVNKVAEDGDVHGGVGCVDCCFSKNRN